MKTLVTGSVGFIGAALTQRLLDLGDEVVGLDNHNDYYDPALKEARLNLFGGHANYRHVRLDIADRLGLERIFEQHRPERVVHLAAQAGVRYSIENPMAYIDSNVVGFANVLENSRKHKISHFVYASTSSVYGANTALPFNERQNVDHPLSLYAATKKSNELMAHAYSHLYGMSTTGLRFFTVYGPWGRPDMALFKFAKAIIENKPIQIYNNGKHRRDFTYIDDIVEGVLRVLDRPAKTDPNWDGLNPDPSTSNAPYRIYNIGNSQTIELMDYVIALEKSLGKPAKKEYLAIQPGDVPNTHADISQLIDQFSYQPKTSIDVGIKIFASWYRSYYGVSEDAC
jgi:UDP-glucuronate 4-epimerase